MSTSEKSPNSKEPKVTNSSFLENTREELRFWPYTIHQIDDTLDSSLIEGRGKQILFQSLNSQKLSVFVGSGMSAAYGRMSWSEWKAEQLRSVNELSESFLDVTRASLDLMNEITRQIDTENHDDSLWQVLRWLEHRQQVFRHARWEVRNLTNTFVAAKSDSGSFPGGEEIPILFEIAKKLHDLLLQYRSLYLEADENVSGNGHYKHNESNLKNIETFYGSRIDSSKGAPAKELKIYKKSAKEAVNNDVNNKKLDTWRVAKRHFKQKSKQYVNLANRPAARMEFHKWAKILLVDECAHAERLLFEGLRDGKETGRVFVKNENKYMDKIRSQLWNELTTNLKRNIDGIRENPDHYRVLTVFKLDLFKYSLKENKKNIPDNWKPLQEYILKYLEQYRDKGAALKASRAFLTPTSRFLVPMLIQLLEEPPVQYLSKKKLQKPAASDFQSRRSILSDHLDPLFKVNQKLGVTRYLTTNYDFEIERLYQDIGYRRFDTHSATPEHTPIDEKEKSRCFRTNGLGGVLRDMTFSTETATDLLAFAAGGDGAEAGVFHLHGRATMEDKIVVTERDYMDMYLRDSAHREVIDESILLAFSASPIFFMGLGMNEADLLRPLRQFISDQDRSIGYRSIVLHAATKDFDSRAKTSSGLYVRYGVHTIFYGSGEVFIKNRNRNKNQSIDWLHRVMTLVDTLKEKAEQRKKDICDKMDERIKIIVQNYIKIENGEISTFDDTSDDLSADVIENLKSEISYLKKNKNNSIDIKNWRDVSCERLENEILKKPINDIGDNLFCRLISLNELKESVGKLGVDLNADGPDRYALPYILGLTKEEFEVQLNLSEGDGLDCNALELQNCHFTTRRNRDETTPERHRQSRIDGAVYTDFYMGILTRLLRMSLESKESDGITIGHELRSLNSMCTAHEGLRGALITASLSAAIEALDKEWREWWLDWQQPPPGREARFEQISNSPVIEKKVDRLVTLPRRVVRHRVVSTITDLSHCFDSRAPVLGANEKMENAFKNCRTNVQIFDRFIDDMGLVSLERTPPIGRLLQTVAASRGQGKGIFFSVLMTSLGLTSYLSSTHRERARQQKAPDFVAAVFINLSFAPEIGSVYDMTRRTLIETVSRLEAVVIWLKDPTTDNDKLSQSFWEKIFNYNLAIDDNDEKKIGENIEICKSKWEADCLGKPRQKNLLELMFVFYRLSKEYADIKGLEPESRPRILIAINAPELLFDEARRPKNQEIQDVLEMLVSRSSRKIPMDILFVGALEELGSFWECDAKPQKINRLPGKDANVDWYYDKNSFVAVTAQQASQCRIERLSSCAGVTPSNTHYVHFTWPVMPVVFLVDNYLTLSIALFLASRNKDEKNEKVGEFPGLLKAEYDRLWSDRDKMWRERTPPDVFNFYVKTKKQLHENVALKIIGNNVVDGERACKDVKELIFTRYKNNDEARISDAREWLELQSVLGGNRFCLTILMAAAEHLVFAKQCIIEGGESANIFLQNISSQLRNASVSQRENVILDAVMSVYHETSIIGMPDHDHDLHQLLLRNLAVLGCPVSPNVLVRLPDLREYFNKTEIEPRKSKSSNSDGCSSTRSAISRRRMVACALSVLCERGLVFRLSPHPKLLRLQDKVEKLWSKKATKNNFIAFLDGMNKHVRCNKTYVNKIVEECNNALAFDYPVESGLNSDQLNDLYTFRQSIDLEITERLRVNGAAAAESIPLLHAYEAFRAWPAKREYRYALHRQMQSYCFQRLGHLTATPVKANSFAPSLYASAPSRVIRLSKEGYLFLRRLMLGLSQYPDIRHSDSARDLPIFSDDNTLTKVQALRAAMSMARTVYSIAAVSRFSDANTGMEYMRKRGYFETYKVRLRWIIRKSWEVHEPLQGREAIADLQKVRVNSLYMDEIVWLYNEVAVTCLVQGALVDGIAHARQAIHINKCIEGQGVGGRMYNLLSLNLAIMQIERGRLGSARKRLSEIQGSESEKHRKIHGLAIGYTALISQLSGQRKNAKNGFEKAIEILRDLDEDRALALMLHHYARLLASEKPKLAIKYLKNARELAESGGHEDVRHRILISQVWLSSKVSIENTNSMQADRLILREVETYARMMDIPSLLVDVLHAQGNILLVGGDTSSSGKLMTRAMAIAKRHDMALRLNTIMTNYSRVLIARRRSVSALRLLNSSLAMAKRCGYSIEVVRIHDVMSQAKRKIGDD